jgi:hypothetical protein
MKDHRITISDEVYEYLKGMIEDEHIENGNMSEEMNDNGEQVAYRPTFSEVVGHLIEDREEAAKAYKESQEIRDIILDANLGLAKKIDEIEAKNKKLEDALVIERAGVLNEYPIKHLKKLLQKEYIDQARKQLQEGGLI